MKKIILILVALVCLVGSVSAKTFLNKTEKESNGVMWYEYIIVNGQIPGYYYYCYDANPVEEKKITTELNSTPEEHEKAKKDTMVREGYGEKPDEVILDFFKEFGTALRVFENNIELNPEVAAITKKHGVSITSDVKGFWIVNTFENGVFNTYLLAR